MKINASCVCCFFVWCMLVVLGKPCPLSAEPLDMDREERMSMDNPFLDVLESETQQEKAPLMESKEIKYIAGQDQKWFTEDDDVHEYFILYYDNQKRLIRRSAFWEGDDSMLMTNDDVLHDYVIYEYGVDGNISREILYDGKGVKQYTEIYGYDDAGQKIKANRYDPQDKEIGSTNFFHGHAGLIIKDVRYKGSEIEKYHLFQYDRKHNAGRITEYLGSAGGKGRDGVWFTDDDVITSKKQCYYNQNGTKDKEKKYIAPGPDGKWFTKDDVLQYYTIFYYQKK